MQYILVQLEFNDTEGFIADLLAASLGEIGFESFETTNEGLNAYIQEKFFDLTTLSDKVTHFPYTDMLVYEVQEVELKNWNEEWEKHFFEPIIIGEECIIHSSFHSNVPQLRYNIIIDPKMAFGTGHHETTSLMIAEILQHDFTGKTVLDMGCGTSVLAILAAKRGATQLTAIDIDDWCVDNSHENIALNQVNGIDVQLGNADLLQGKNFDVVLANINRNILLNDMAQYAETLPSGGTLFISGFYTEDIPALVDEAQKNHLQFKYNRKKNNWAMIKFEKE